MEGAEFDWDRFSVFRKDYLDNVQGDGNSRTNANRNDTDSFKLRCHTFPEQNIRHRNGKYGDAIRSNVTKYNYQGMTTGSNSCKHQYAKKGLDEIQSILDRFCDKESDTHQTSPDQKSLSCMYIDNTEDGPRYDAQKHFRDTLVPPRIDHIGREKQITMHQQTVESRTLRSTEQMCIESSSEEELSQIFPTLCNNGDSVGIPKINISVPHYDTVEESGKSTYATPYSSPICPFTLSVDSPRKENLGRFLEINKSFNVFDSDSDISKSYKEEAGDRQTVMISKSESCRLLNADISNMHLCQTCAGCKNAEKIAIVSSDNRQFQSFVTDNRCPSESTRISVDDVNLSDNNKYTSHDSVLLCEDMMRHRSNTMPPILADKACNAACSGTVNITKKRSNTFSGIFKFVRNRLRRQSTLPSGLEPHLKSSNVSLSPSSITESHTTKTNSKAQICTGAIKSDYFKDVYDLSEKVSNMTYDSCHYMTTEPLHCSREDEWAKGSTGNDSFPKATLASHPLFPDVELPLSPTIKSCCMMRPFPFNVDRRNGAGGPELRHEISNDDLLLHQIRRNIDSQMSRPRQSANTTKSLPNETDDKEQDKLKVTFPSHTPEYQFSDSRHDFPFTFTQNTRQRRRAYTFGSLLSYTGRKVRDTFRARFSSDVSRCKRKQRQSRLEFRQPLQSRVKAFTMFCLKGDDNTSDDDQGITFLPKAKPQDVGVESEISVSHKISSNATKKKNYKFRTQQNDQMKLFDNLHDKRKRGMKEKKYSKRHDEFLSSSVSKDKSMVKRALKSIASMSNEDFSDVSTIVNLKFSTYRKDSNCLFGIQTDAGKKCSPKKSSYFQNGQNRPRKSLYCKRLSNTFYQRINSSNIMHRSSAPSTPSQENAREQAQSSPLKTKKQTKAILLYRFPGHSGNCKKHIERYKKYVVSRKRFKGKQKIRKRSGLSAPKPKTSTTTSKTGNANSQSKN